MVFKYQIRCIRIKGFQTTDLGCVRIQSKWKLYHLFYTDRVKLWPSRLFGWPLTSSTPFTQIILFLLIYAHPFLLSLYFSSEKSKLNRVHLSGGNVKQSSWLQNSIKTQKLRVQNSLAQALLRQVSHGVFYLIHSWGLPITRSRHSMHLISLLIAKWWTDRVGSPHYLLFCVCFSYIDNSVSFIIYLYKLRYM